MKNNEFATKNDFLFFQNEILGDIKNIDFKMNEKFTHMSKYIETQNSFNEKKMQNISALIEKLSKKVEEKTDLDKFDEKLKLSLKNMQDLTVKLEIKFNIINKDLKDACFKYDKIISNNLVVPGVIGVGCPYENLKYFIEYANVKLAELIKSKDKQTLDNKAYKEKMEGIIKQNQIQFEAMNIKLNDILQQEVKKNDNLCRQRIEDLYQKIEMDKNDNDKLMKEYKINFDKIGNDFNKFYNEDLNNLLNLINEFEHEKKKNIDKFIDINIKLKNIEDLIKKSQTKRNSIIHKSIKDIVYENRNIRDNNNIMNNELINKKISLKRFDIKRESNKNQNNSNRNNTNEQIPIINNSDKNINKENKKINTSFNKNEEEKKINIEENQEKPNNSNNVRNFLTNNIKNNEIKSKEIKSNEIKNNEIKNNEIKGKEIKNNEIKGKEIKSNEIKRKEIKSNEIKSNEINHSKSRNINNNLNKEFNLSEIKNKSENYNINNSELKKLEFKALKIQKEKSKNNSIEIKKVHDNINYDSNEIKEENNANLFKVINFKNVINKNNKRINNIKNKRFIEIANNPNSNYNTIDYKNKYSNNLNISDNIKLHNVSIGGEFSENDLYFVNNPKYNLSQAYFLAKARMEDQQRLKPNNLLSSLLLNGTNSVKSFGKNRFKFQTRSLNLKKKQLKEKDIHEKYINGYSSFNDYIQEFFNFNFPSIYKNPQEIPSIHKNILEKQAMYLSYMNNKTQNKNNIFVKDANKTQIDYNSLNENEIKNINILKKSKNKKFRKNGSPFNDVLLVKTKPFSPINMSNLYLDKSNNNERNSDLSYEKGKARDTLHHVKSFLIKKFKEDFT